MPGCALPNACRSGARHISTCVSGGADVLLEPMSVLDEMQRKPHGQSPAEARREEGDGIGLVLELAD